MLDFAGELLRESIKLTSTEFTVFSKNHTLSTIFKSVYDSINNLNLNNQFLLCLLELNLLEKINEKETRNYYLWKHLLLIMNKLFIKKEVNEYNEKSLVIILQFGISILINNNLDYSAFHFMRFILHNERTKKTLINYFLKNKSQVSALFEYLNTIEDSIVQEKETKENNNYFLILKSQLENEVNSN